MLAAELLRLEQQKWLIPQKFDFIRKYLIEENGISDSGYLLYLTSLYKVMGPNIFLTRVIKCFISAFTCILLYKLSRRSMGESVGRMVGIFAMLFPNLIFYCGLHLKETEMNRLPYCLRIKENQSSIAHQHITLLFSPWRLQNLFRAFSVFIVFGCNIFCARAQAFAILL